MKRISFISLSFVVTLSLLGSGCRSTTISQPKPPVPTGVVSSSGIINENTPTKLLAVNKTTYKRASLYGTDFSVEIPVGWVMENVTRQAAKIEAERFQNTSDEEFLSTSTHGIPTHLFRVRYLSSEIDRMSGEYRNGEIKIWIFVAPIDEAFLDPPPEPPVEDNELPSPPHPINKTYAEAFGIDEGMGGVSAVWYKPHVPSTFKGDSQTYYDIVYFGGGGTSPDLKNISEQIAHMRATLIRK